jgi:hypothetical protein
MLTNTRLLNLTVYLSLIVQILSGIANIWILQTDTHPQFNILRQLIYTELGVQIIEVIFYAWLSYNLVSVKNITPNRYYDWIFTTPTMLITVVVFFIYLKNKDNGENISKLDMFDIIKQESIPITIICALNAGMIIAGYLGETNKISINTSVLLGFIAFTCYFYIIYKNYVTENTTIQWIFFTFAGLWSLYGMSALLSYEWKNISYNILDLLSKNFFGIFLTYVLYTEHEKYLSSHK